MINEYRLRARIVVFLAALLLPLTAAADTTLHYQVSHGGDSRPMTLKARSGAVRVEGAAMGERFKWMVYRSADDTLYAFDPQGKVYLPLNEAAIEQIGQQLKERRARRQEQLENAPTWQRKFAESQGEEFLRSRDQRPEAVEIRMGDETGEIDGVACRKGQLVTRGDKAGELCAASIEAIGMSRDEFAAYHGLYKLINHLQSALSGAAAKAPDLTTLDGVPISMHMESGRITQSLHDVTHEALDDDLFDIPDGYRRQEPWNLVR